MSHKNNFMIILYVIAISTLSLFSQGCSSGFESAVGLSSIAANPSGIDGATLKIEAIGNELYITPANPIVAIGAMHVWQKSSEQNGTYTNVSNLSSSDMLNVKSLNLPFTRYVRLASALSNQDYNYIIASAPLFVSISEQQTPEVPTGTIAITAPAESEAKVIAFQVVVSDYQNVERVRVTIGSYTDNEYNNPYDFSFDARNYPSGEYTILAEINYGSKVVTKSQKLTITEPIVTPTPTITPNPTPTPSPTTAPTPASERVGVILQKNFYKSVENLSGIVPLGDDRPEYYSITTAPDGSRALKLRLDCKASKLHRAEIRPSGGRWEQGVDYWIGIRAMLPTTTEVIDQHRIYFQIHSSGTAVPVEIRAGTDQYGWNDLWSYKLRKISMDTIYPYTKDLGQWVNWVVHYKGGHQNNGVIEIWQDGVLIVSKNNVSTAVDANDTLQLQTGIYEGYRRPTEDGCQVGMPGEVSEHYTSQLIVAKGPNANYYSVQPGDY